jgi:hypothetical protein
MTLRYFGRMPPSQGALSELQMLGRLANAFGLTETPWPFALLPGTKPKIELPQEHHAQAEEAAATEPS